MSYISIETVSCLAAELGLSVVGACNLDQLANEKQHLKVWQNSGFAGEMKYMQRPAELLTATQHILPETRSVLSFTIQYSSEPHPELPPNFGRVARYAWGLDYHQQIPLLLNQLIKRVEEYLGYPFKYRVFTDALPFLERAGARSAGLGFIGKNTMLIRPGTGSFFFIAEIFWDIEVEDSRKLFKSGTCGSCTRCQVACPTDAFVEPFILNAPRCISYLTIEKKGAHSINERQALGEWIFGCDICQDVCPFNHASIKKSIKADIHEFYKEKGVGALIDLAQVLKIRSNKEFEQRFKDTPLLRPGRVGIQRNALAVAANTKALELTPLILELVNSDSPILRQTALWTLITLEPNKPIALRLLERALIDDDPSVREEALSLKVNR
jgi:epoxyqueuosine reductase